MANSNPWQPFWGALPEYARLMGRVNRDAYRLLARHVARDADNSKYAINYLAAVDGRLVATDGKRMAWTPLQGDGVHDDEDAVLYPAALPRGTRGEHVTLGTYRTRTSSRVLLEACTPQWTTYAADRPTDRYPETRDYVEAFEEIDPLTVIEIHAPALAALTAAALAAAKSAREEKPVRVELAASADDLTARAVVADVTLEAPLLAAPAPAQQPAVGVYDARFLADAAAAASAPRPVLRWAFPSDPAAGPAYWGAPAGVRGLIAPVKRT